jgi:hypothetical protein
MNGPRRAWPIAILLCLAAPAVQATAICRWVDESGRTHLADSVPDRYRAQARCTDSRQYELSPDQVRSAQQRAAEEQSGASERSARRAASTASAPAPTAGAASRPAQKRPATVITEGTDCATRWRLYDESAACFGPFRTTRGGIKPEAYAVCNEVPRPEVQCGLRRE